jgi:hypothetical protein
MAMRWTLEEQERGLRELANCRGHREMAAQRLAERGLPIPAKTLSHWAYQVPATRARYAELRVEVEGQVHETIAHEYENLALKALEVQSELLGDLSEKRAGLTAKELATAVNATATAGGIATDKAQVLRGKPSVIVENRNPYELIGKWFPEIAEAYRDAVDGEAEEMDGSEAQLAAGAEGAAAPATRADVRRQRAPAGPPGAGPTP